MKTSDLIEETYLALVSNKARSGLTILGIVIGIGSVIAMIAIGQGTQASITSSIESLGSNLVMVMPGAQRSAGSFVSSGRGSAQTLTIADSDAIKTGIPLAKNVAPITSGRYQVVAKGTNTNTQVVGTTAEYTTVKNISIDQGVFFGDQQVKSGTKVAVLGPTTANDLFGSSTSPVGQTIKIKGIEFKVIGTTVAKGGSGFNNQDDMIYIL